MTERLGRLPWIVPLAVLVVLAAATLVPPPDGLTLAARSSDGAAAVRAVLDEVPAGGTVTVGFDPDVGTYPEIRSATRSLIAAVTARDVTLAFVSLTPEGRALLVSERGRGMAADVAGEIVDLGFVAGSEAALASLSARAVPVGGGTAGGLRAEGLGASDLMLVIGGNDIGPRTWVEQVLPRVGPTPLVAVTPTILLPETLPYLETGQVDALIGTPGDAAAFIAAEGGSGDPVDGDRPANALAVVVGLLMAFGALGHALVARVVPAARLRGFDAG
jgi:hypothetical protein